LNHVRAELGGSRYEGEGRKQGTWAKIQGETRDREPQAQSTDKKINRKFETWGGGKKVRELHFD